MQLKSERNSMNSRHSISEIDIKSILVGTYAWFTAITFGLVLLDTVYGSLVPDASRALQGAADFLIFINALTILTAIGAVGSVIDKKPARNCITASLILTVFGYLLYMTIFPVLKYGSPYAPPIRIILTASISVLALMGFYRYCREPLIVIPYDQEA